MAARKNKGVGPGSYDSAWKERIQAAMIANRLHDIFEGKVDLTPVQLKAGLALFDKLEPSLARSEHSGPDGGPIKQSVEVRFVDTETK